ncbi:MAG: NAD-binding protein, partial [Eudoraea sp.]
VLLNATTARYVARLLGVFLKHSEGILIIGASKMSRLIASYLKQNNRHVVLIDNNHAHITQAKKLGLEAMVADVYSDTLGDNIELNDMGYLMALTGSAEINEYVIERFKHQFGENGSFRLVSAEEMNDPQNNPEEGLFSHTDDFIKLMEAIRSYPAVHEIELKNGKHYQQLIDITNEDDEIIPIFIKAPDGEIHIITSFSENFNTISEGYKLVYLGKMFDMDKIP